MSDEEKIQEKINEEKKESIVVAYEFEQGAMLDFSDDIQNLIKFPQIDFMSNHCSLKEVIHSESEKSKWKKASFLVDEKCTKKINKFVDDINEQVFKVEINNQILDVKLQPFKTYYNKIKKGKYSYINLKMSIDNEKLIAELGVK